MISQLEKEVTLRYLKTRKKDGFLNVISIFAKRSQDKQSHENRKDERTIHKRTRSLVL